MYYNTQYLEFFFKLLSHVHVEFHEQLKSWECDAFITKFN